MHWENWKNSDALCRRKLIYVESWHYPENRTPLIRFAGITRMTNGITVIPTLKDREHVKVPIWPERDISDSSTTH